MNKLESILNYLKTQEQQDPPSIQTIQTIAAAIEMSVEATQHMLTVLRDKGYIAWEPKKGNTIRLLRPA